MATRRKREIADRMLTDAFLGTILHGNTAMLEKKMLFQSLYKWIVAF